MKFFCLPVGKKRLLFFLPLFACGEKVIFFLFACRKKVNFFTCGGKWNSSVYLWGFFSSSFFPPVCLWGKSDFFLLACGEKVKFFTCGKKVKLLSVCLWGRG